MSEQVTEYTDEQIAAALDALTAPPTNTDEPHAKRMPAPRKAAPRMPKRISKAKAAKLQQKSDRLAKNAVDIQTDDFDALMRAISEVTLCYILCVCQIRLILHC